MDSKKGRSESSLEPPAGESRCLCSLEEEKTVPLAGKASKSVEGLGGHRNSAMKVDPEEKQGTPKAQS